jgi:hypothetical protein
LAADEPVLTNSGVSISSITTRPMTPPQDPNPLHSAPPPYGAFDDGGFSSIGPTVPDVASIQRSMDRLAIGRDGWSGPSSSLPFTPSAAPGFRSAPGEEEYDEEDDRPLGLNRNAPAAALSPKPDAKSSTKVYRVDRARIWRPLS